MIGFLHADGSLSEATRNRGRLTVELNKVDKGILYEFKKLIPVKSSITERTRDTNFKQGSESATLTVHDLGFRNFLKSVGCLVGRKDLIVAPPEPLPYPVDYFRGYVDGNGSLGFSQLGLPFVSITTNSDGIKNFVSDFLLQHLGCRKKISRNTRDNIYNIMVMRQGAVDLARLLYLTDNALCLPRKLRIAEALQKWISPFPIKKCQSWLPEDDTMILTLPLAQAAQHLKRTEQSIKMRLWRLRGRAL